jgi:hypothetical protein
MSIPAIGNCKSVVDVARAADRFELHERRRAVAVVVADVDGEGHLRAFRPARGASQKPLDVPECSRHSGSGH